MSCEDDSCPWSVRAICCKGDNLWKIAKCKGPHTCDKIQNAHDGRMIDSVFLAYVLERYIREDPAYKIKNLRHVALADLKHEVSHYKVFYSLTCIIFSIQCRDISLLGSIIMIFFFSQNSCILYIMKIEIEQRKEKKECGIREIL